MVVNFKQISKNIAYILRHYPDQFDLKLDHEGWVEVNQLIRVLRKQNKEWRNIDSSLIEKINNEATKCRFEIRKNRIRALYGHSTSAKLVKTLSEPPEKLYHGTSPLIINKIMTEGLNPMRRQYVHLSSEIDTARIAGYRKATKPIILVIDALMAFHQGIGFYLANDDIWLADSTTSIYIKILNN